MLKKITLGLIATLSMNVAAFAEGPGLDVPIPAAPAFINVTSPVQQASWELGLELGYYQPANENFQYAQGTLDDGRWKNYKIDPRFQWTGHADLTYRTPGPGGFVQVGATHFSSNESNTRRVDSDTGDLGDTSDGSDVIALNSPFNSLNTFYSKFSTCLDGNYKVAKGVSRDSYTDVDLVAGRTIDVGARTRFNFYGGLRYANINNDNKGTYVQFGLLPGPFGSGGAPEPITHIDEAKMDSDFNGVGLRAGVSTEVNLAYGFSFVGNIATSLLTGSLEQKVTGTATGYSPLTGDVTYGSSVRIKDSSDVRVVPELDARLGLHYNYGFTPFTSLGLEVGYQTTNYFAAVSADLVDIATPNTVANSNNFGFQGPYFRAQINVA